MKTWVQVAWITVMILSGSSGIVVGLSGCAGPSIGVVKPTLQSYQVGVTSFADFERDAALILVKRVSPPSYLDARRNARTNIVYTVRKGSPWRIYESSEHFSLIHGIPSSRSRYVVGDAYEPVCILTFDGSGKLTDKSPVPDPR